VQRDNAKSKWDSRLCQVDSGVKRNHGISWWLCHISPHGCARSTVHPTLRIKSILFFGGHDYSGSLPDNAWKYVPGEESWSLLDTNSAAGRLHLSMLSGASSRDSLIVVFGGQNALGTALDDMSLFLSQPQHVNSE
jgi:hypothetical protein